MWLSLVEHHVRDVGAASSNLVTSTKRSRIPFGILFFIAARFELADEFPNTQPRSGAGVREEPPEEVPIKSGKSESPRPKEAGYRLVSCFFIAARFELADEFPNTQPRSGAAVRLNYAEF